MPSSGMSPLKDSTRNICRNSSSTQLVGSNQIARQLQQRRPATASDYPYQTSAKQIVGGVCTPCDLGGGISRPKWNSNSSPTFYFVRKPTFDFDIDQRVRRINAQDEAAAFKGGPRIPLRKHREHSGKNNNNAQRQNATTKAFLTGRSKNDKCRMFLGMEFPAERLFKVSQKKASNKNEAASNAAKEDRTEAKPDSTEFQQKPKECTCGANANNIQDPANKIVKPQQQQRPASASRVENRVQDYQSKLDELHKLKLVVLNAKDLSFGHPQRRHFPLKTSTALFKKYKVGDAGGSNCSSYKDTLISNEGMTLMSRKNFPQKNASVISLV